MSIPENAARAASAAYLAIVDMGRSTVVAEAHSWLRTPFHHAARVKGAGVDCAQLLAAVYEGAGLIPPVTFDQYQPQWMIHRDTERLLDVVLQYAVEVPAPTGPGDLLLFKHGRAFSHGAIIIDWPIIIHAAPRCGVILDEAEGPNLGGREKRFFTLWGK